MFNTLFFKNAFHVTNDLRNFVMHIPGLLINLTFNLYSFVFGNH